MSMILSETLNNLPKISILENARSQIRDYNKGKKIVVLDDDPTGCQTVHGIHVIMRWDEETLKEAIKKYDHFYILHNTRSLSAEEAYKLNLEISQTLLKFIPKEDLTLVSRSDSTLRGHFMPEISALTEITGPYDGIIFMPFFKEGGRLTIANEHYVVQGEMMVPACETEFANDAVFGFKSSNLPTWIKEKNSKISNKDEVITISLEDIRLGGLDKVMQKLSKSQQAQFISIDAVDDHDVEIVILALNEIKKTGKRFLIRSAASLVKILMGLEDIPLWRPETAGTRGVIIAGSHVKKTTEQIKSLTDSYKLMHMELSIKSILDENNYFEICVAQLNKSLSENQTMLISTERTYQLTGTDNERLAAGRKISDFLSGLINKIKEVPDFIVAKGGITSNDVAKYGLEIVDAEVLGQIQPGVPVWKPGNESKFPNCPYIVFPGNVGEANTLKKVFEILTNK